MNLIKNSKVLSAIIALSVCTATQANVSNVHTWTTVYSLNGTWSGTLSSINEHATFVDANGQPMSQFTIDELTPVKYGFSFGENDDFDVAYTLTMTQKNTQQSNSLFSSKTCVFVVTAISPAHPDIQMIPYNGAQCTSEALGGKFYVE
jgi:hypothetical protein